MLITIFWFFFYNICRTQNQFHITHELEDQYVKKVLKTNMVSMLKLFLTADNSNWQAPLDMNIQDKVQRTG